jgi:hypothetical protein
MNVAQVLLQKNSNSNLNLKRKKRERKDKRKRERHLTGLPGGFSAQSLARPKPSFRARDRILPRGPHWSVPPAPLRTSPTRLLGRLLRNRIRSRRARDPACAPNRLTRGAYMLRTASTMLFMPQRCAPRHTSRKPREEIAAAQPIHSRRGRIPSCAAIRASCGVRALHQDRGKVHHSTACGSILYNSGNSSSGISIVASSWAWVSAPPSGVITHPFSSYHLVLRVACLQFEISSLGDDRGAGGRSPPWGFCAAARGLVGG